MYTKKLYISQELEYITRIRDRKNFFNILQE